MTETKDLTDEQELELEQLRNENSMLLHKCTKLTEENETLSACNKNLWSTIKTLNGSLERLWKSLSS